MLESGRAQIISSIINRRSSYDPLELDFHGIFDSGLHSHGGFYCSDHLSISFEIDLNKPYFQLYIFP